ncbi:hypothetical protein MLD38_036292 [Melastoma candidum]|uniref:Uncharacterized protein n=1 Tax=Melastoma candidum TaxID=119954 RepID=A0ACB9LL34_9MYRT|nr:hypothetical protein MLD38_036292 [Melastoma candidum]
MSTGRSGGGSRVNGVFYAQSYHPIQAGSIDGTDVLPHDNAVYRAHLCSSASLYDPFRDPKSVGDPYCTLFVGRLSHFTSEDSLRLAMSKYGRVKSLHLVRHIVTGASRGYAFVEYETEREMRRAYKDAHHAVVDDSEIIVDYNRQQLMPGWIPRRLGGGLGGKKESGQLRFGGRERPFRAPLRPIPFDELKRLGIPPPPEGNYMSRYEVPSPPRREKGSLHGFEGSERDNESNEGPSHRRGSEDREHHRDRYSSEDEDYYYSKRSSKDQRSVKNRDEYFDVDRSQSSVDEVHHSRKRSSADHESHSHKRSKRRSKERDKRHNRRSPDEDSHQRRTTDAERHGRYNR